MIDENGGVSKLVCPRCGRVFKPVRGKLPIHTRDIDALTFDGRFTTKKAVVCE